MIGIVDTHTHHMNTIEYSKLLGDRLSAEDRVAIRNALDTLEGLLCVGVVNALYDAAERNESAGYAGTAFAQKAQFHTLCDVKGVGS